MDTVFDLIVIGGGPGGYVAAIRGAQLGMTVAMIEKRSELGGTCLNVGCIPSKALLDSSEHYHQAKEKFAVHGISTGKLSVDIQQMMKRKGDVVKATTQGIEFLMKKNKITVFNGLASFENATTVSVKKADASTEKVIGKNIVIATGSEPTPLPSAPFDGKRVISSTEALELTEVPGHLLVVGGGVIGVEMASIYARLGAKVSIIEFADGLIPTMDRELGRHLQKSLSKLGMDFHFQTKVTGSQVKGKKVILTAQNAQNDTVTFEGDYALVCIGRRPFTQGLNLEKAGVTLDERSRIQINAHLQTKVPHIYAIGDVVVGPMLAHKASEEGAVCVERIAGQKPHLNPDTIPGVVYTWPEVASVGKTEEELKAAGVAYKTGKFPFKASGRARASEESEGLVKVLANQQTDEILGMHIIGPRAADMIATGVCAMEYRASAEDLARMVAAHPTFSEAIKEAALDATEKRAIHI